MKSQKPDPNKKAHWFLLSYMIPMPGQWQPVSFMGSYTSKVLNTNALNALRKSNNLGDDAILTSISYIGFASKHYIACTNDAPVASSISDAYRQGMTVALTADPNIPNVNPYEEHAGVNRDMYFRANEWADGYAEGVAIRDTAKALQGDSSLSGVPMAPTVPDAE